MNGYIQGCCNGYDDTTIGPFYYFEYGTTTSVGNKTDETPTLNWLPDTNEPSATMSATIRNLQSDTKYYYRLVQKIGDANESGFNYWKSDIESFRTLDDAEEPDENGLTDEQIEGLEDLGFTQVQINMIIALFDEPDRPSVDPRCSYHHTVTLRQGMMGEAVWKMQLALDIDTDSKFGPMTAIAVKHFQASYGLNPDGIVGPATGAKIAASCVAQ